jgi:glycosyltransferase involved in cell wall biosynthesis
MKEPLVSVKMITYNHAPFIAKAIEGVLQQKTTFPFELVIGEDCSTDGTREIVFEYQKKYPDIIRVITSDMNVGMKKNGYRTSKACRGKYIAYCEGDDYWHHPDKMEKQADYLESHTEYGLVFSNYDVYHVEIEKIIECFIEYRKWDVPESPSINDVVSGKNFILTCTVMLRRALWEHLVESDPYLHQSEKFLMGDTQLWAEMSTISHIHYMPESFATHTITEESATRSKDIKKELKFIISGAELMVYLCNKYGLSDTIRMKYEEDIQRYSLQLAFHSRDAVMANKARKMKGTLTLTEWLHYYGADNIAIHHTYMFAIRLSRILRKTQYQWS